VFEPQRILVTGASSGFGAVTVRALAAAGHRVFACFRDLGGRGAVASQALAAWAEAEGRAVTILPLDVTDEASADAAVRAAVAEAGGLDVLVNNAGVAAAGLVETFTPAAAQRLFDVNVFGPLRMLRAALPTFRAQGQGLIIYLSSTDGREVMPFLGLYNASKAALEALAEACHYELSGLGVESVVVQPGTFPTTAILQNLIPADDPARAEGYGPVREGPGQLFAGLQAMIDQGAAPDPALVAEAILAVVEAPRGTRPRRLPLDPSGFDGAARINRVCAEVQSDLLARFGLSGLDPR
jgi:NAD(P)-dependent dehydrogenase (short-subunit alcohol dehydrogenase family)